MRNPVTGAGRFYCTVLKTLSRRFIQSILIYCLAGAGAGVADTSVWEITKGQSIVYLGGTIHALSASDFPLPGAFDEAYKRSGEVYFEVDLRELSDRKHQALMEKKSLYPEGVTLKSRLTVATWELLDKYLNTHGLSAEQVNHIRPGAIMSAVISLELEKTGAVSGGVDHHLFQRSLTDGRVILPLESAESQISMLSGLGMNNEELFIRNLIEDMGNFSVDFDRLRSAWLHGDNKKLLEASGYEKLKRGDPSTFRALLSDRNNKWLVDIEEMFDSVAIEFVLVGVVHLIGEDGLLNLLEANGYEVRQLQKH